MGKFLVVYQKFIWEFFSGSFKKIFKIVFFLPRDQIVLEFV